jgi:ketosteroid isomerase-like protein
MARRLVLALLVLFIGGAAPHAQQAATAEAEVRKAESDRFNAFLKGDAAALDKLLSPDLIYTHGDGRVVDKATFIAELKTGDFKYVSIEAEEPRIKVFGDTAIVTSRAGMRVINKGAPAQIRIVYTNVHLRRNGSWQMVAWQATRLAQ